MRRVQTISEYWRFLAWVQPAAWIALSTLYFAFDLGRAPDCSAPKLLLRAAIWTAVGGAIATVALLLHYAAGLRTPGRASALVVVCSVLGGLLWLALFNGLDGALELEAGWTPLSTWRREDVCGEWMDATLMLLVWHGVAFSIFQRRCIGLCRVRAMRLQRARTQAHLATLRGQVNPHLLFNALNSAMELVHEDADRAEDALQRLGSLLRATLTATSAWHPLADEFDRVEDYLAIERLRLEERLVVVWSVDVDPEEFLAPPGILFPLIDNAVKHGDRGAPHPLKIEISARLSDSKLDIAVKNDGVLKNDAHERSLGIGLTNVRERLTSESGAAGSLSLSEDSGVVTARLRFSARRVTS